MMHPVLISRLRPAARRLAVLRSGWRVAAGWSAAAVLVFAVWGAQKVSGISSSAAWLMAGLVGLGVALWVGWRGRRRAPDWRAVAARIESAHPELDGRLLTAVQQNATTLRGLGYLQERVVLEALDHAHRHRWHRAIPLRGVFLARAAQGVAFALFIGAVWMLRSTASPGLLVVQVRPEISVEPGDTGIEKGDSLVVLARFGRTVPARAELVLSGDGAPERRQVLTRSLSDPVFGGSVASVTNRLTYRIEYDGARSRDYVVTVFEHPRLERADADLAYPGYTAMPSKRIEDTRRVTALEGTRVALSLRLNKPVAGARLVPRAAGAPVIDLIAATNEPAASLPGFTLLGGGVYDLRLVDADGRTNKLPATFTFTALTNRLPELRLTAPRGDIRPSALEELDFEGTVFDDFGLQAYGLAWMRPGDEPQYVELGRDVPGREKRPFKHQLALEGVGVRPDDLVSWCVWAEDLGPDGAPRRTHGDLFFGEVRPFDEVFREGEGEAGGADQPSQPGQGGQGQGGASGQLAELQKQIMTATWKLLRDPPSRRPRGRDPAGTSAPPTGTVRAGTGRWYAMPLGRAGWLAQPAPPGRGERRAPSRTAPEAGAGAAASGAAPDDATVLRESQAQALEMAEQALAEAEDPRLIALWETAKAAMETALAKLEAAGESPEALREAFAAEQAAYQALLKLQEHEFSVSRSRNRSRQQGQGAGTSRQRQMQRQLDQLELRQSENRYQTETQAQAPMTAGEREQMQVLNRLRELARRQEDLNDRLQALQTALQEARTEPEREELRRELKRLQEEERQMLADMDELQERMDRPENQSRLADQRRQMEQARQDLQRAAESLGEGAVSQALAAGARARQQLEDMREELRRESAGAFAEDLRQMRSQARELDRQQEEIRREVESLGDASRRTLDDSTKREALLEELARQKQRLTNLVARATEISRESEEAEPLVSRELYDSLRRFSQDDATQMKRMRQELSDRGLLTYSLDDRLQAGASEEAQGLELTAEMVRRTYLPQAAEAEARARAGIADLRQGVERAAEKVLGDEAQALRFAQAELDDLTRQIERELEDAGESPPGARPEGRPGGRPDPPPSGTSPPDAGERAATPPEADPQAGGPEQAGAPRESAAGPEGSPQDRPGEQARGPGGQQATGAEPEGREGSRSAEPGRQAARSPGSGGAGDRSPPADPEARPGEPGTPAERAAPGERQAGARPADGNRRGGRGLDLDSLLGTGPAEDLEGPLTGGDFARWSDRLREVEELLEFPDLRGDVASARERARQIRQDFRRNREKPDWAVVRLQILRPLVDVRNRIGEELARRDPRERLVPLDRDPVPGRYSEHVRRYYEELGRGSAP